MNTLKSNIDIYPCFIPVRLSDELVSKLCLNTKKIKLEADHQFNYFGMLNLYFQKFFAGNMSLQEVFSDLPIENLYLWSVAKISNDIHVKQVVNDRKKFNNALSLIKSNNSLNKASFAKYNKLLQPKRREFGYRKGNMRVGDPSKIDYAFYAPPVDKLDVLLENVFDFVKSKNISKVNIALIAMFQLIFIHPFKDGNGRVVRALTISFLEKELGVIPAYLLILYFKVINPVNYYLALNSYREGNIKEIKRFHVEAINWAYKSKKILFEFIEGYIQQTGLDKIYNYPSYLQVVVKSEPNECINQNIFKFHSKKEGKNISINTALLNVLNQFDYYLRYELRTYQQSKYKQ